MGKRTLVLCSHQVDKSAVSRKVIDGVEHIIVKSFPISDGLVMNGGLYPAEEIAKSFSSLNETLAPVEHPKDSKGNFISASAPHAIHNYHAGAFNMNAKYENGRVSVEKHINVPEAMKSERGKRLLDRIEEIETNDSARPIHTSTGLLLHREPLDSPMTANGKEYTWIGRHFTFDHDAILLDSIGAAQPHEGVGMAVNSKGEEFEVLVFNNAPEQTQIIDNADSTDDADAVDTPTKIEGNAMKELVLNALKSAKVELKDGATDAEALELLTVTLQANQSNGDDANEGQDTALVASLVANVEQLTKDLGSMKSQLNTNHDEELKSLSELIGNSDTFAGLDSASAAKLPLETLKGMSASLTPSHGIPARSPAINSDEFVIEMPE